MTSTDQILAAVQRRLDESCPCRRRQTHADTVFGPCNNRACHCYFLGEGNDQCLWEGHVILKDAVLRAAIEQPSPETEVAIRREVDQWHANYLVENELRVTAEAVGARLLELAIKRAHEQHVYSILNEWGDHERGPLPDTYGTCGHPDCKLVRQPGVWVRPPHKEQ